MFNFNSSPSPAPTYGDLLSMHHAVSFSSASPTAPAEIPRGGGGGGGFFHDNGGLLSLPDVAASAPRPYSSSLPSYYIHRSATSSHYFPPHHLPSPGPRGGNASAGAAFSCSSSSPSACQVPLPPVSSSPSSSSGDLLEFSSGTMRRVFSTGDLQGMNLPPSPPAAPFSGDGCGQEVGGPLAQKVGRYSAEERKERIEKYRVKRHQRNFHKKITYACRKTLADSRPRVQGRFARNAETEAEVAASDNGYEYSPYSDRLDAAAGGGGYGYDDGLMSQCRGGAASGGSIGSALDHSSRWWWETPASVAVAASVVGQHHHHHQQQQLRFDDDVVVDEDELWASLADMCSGT